MSLVVHSSDPWHWGTAVAIARSAARWLLDKDRSRRVLNVNVPPLPLDEVRGARWADIDTFGHFRVAVADVPGEKLQFEVSGAEREVTAASDTAVCRDGEVSLTLLSPLQPAAFPTEPASAVWRPDGDSVEQGGARLNPSGNGHTFERARIGQGYEEPGHPIEGGTQCPPRYET